MAHSFLAALQGLRAQSAGATRLNTPDVVAPRLRAVGRSASVPLRSGLIAGCALALGIAVWMGDPSGYLQADPALARLLRGMALIKGMLALGAVGAVFWRFAWPVGTFGAAVYLLGSCALVGSTMLIWQLSHIVLAAVLFHGAALGLLVYGWRER
jgi:hypothetical protein